MRHILVVNNGSLLEEGIMRLLTSQEGLDILSIHFEGEAILVRELETLHPDVVIIYREGPIDLAQLVRSLADSPDLNHLQILIVSANSNIITVLENQKMYEIHSRDFFDFLKSTPIK